MSIVSFADVVHQQITFNPEVQSHQAVLKLIDDPWVQRLREISQTANTRLVYMFSEHSRFGHCLGVAYLACQLMDKLASRYPEHIEPYRTAVAVAALLHDIGHLAPGSHTAHRAWFPDLPDTHEEMAARIIREYDSIKSLLGSIDRDLPEVVIAILEESSSVPPWTWEIISGGGWNVDRGNWCAVDSVLAGVSYGHYNIPALTDSIVLTTSGHLALLENRLDAMMHFTVSRHAMYRQVYQHRVLLSADTITRSVIRRARDLGADLPFADEHMQIVLAARSPSNLPLHTVFWMRESWWRYHLYRWAQCSDTVLRDLSERLLHRRLFKTVRLPSDESQKSLEHEASQAVIQAGYDPKYYLHRISTIDMHAGDSKHSMSVLLDDGGLKPLPEAEPMFQTMVSDSKLSMRAWLCMPKEAKELLGRVR